MKKGHSKLSKKRTLKYPIEEICQNIPSKQCFKRKDIVESKFLTSVNYSVQYR